MLTFQFYQFCSRQFYRLLKGTPLILHIKINLIITRSTTQPVNLKNCKTSSVAREYQNMPLNCSVVFCSFELEGQTKGQDISTSAASIVTICLILMSLQDEFY